MVCAGSGKSAWISILAKAYSFLCKYIVTEVHKKTPIVGAENNPS
jgi:hypothetical protein